MTESIKTIKLSATLTTLAGAKTIEVPVSANATARDLLYAIKRTHPTLGDQIVNEAGELTSGIQFLVGGRHIDFLQGLDTPIDDVDSFMLIPPLYGG